MKTNELSKNSYDLLKTQEIAWIQTSKSRERPENPRQANNVQKTNSLPMMAEQEANKFMKENNLETSGRRQGLGNWARSLRFPWGGGMG
jgi:hypothetical protein